MLKGGLIGGAAGGIMGAINGSLRSDGTAPADANANDSLRKANYHLVVDYSKMPTISEWQMANTELVAWYVDVNISGGYILGGTGGLLISDSGIYPYVGGGLTTPGAGASITWSPSNITEGWNVGFQGQAGAAGQVGYGFGQGGGWFWEIGGGWPPSLSLTGYHIFKPIYIPGRR